MKKLSAKVEEQEVRERLIIAAARQFTQKGYAGASVREIVEEVGVTKPVLYYYFESKEGIYRAIMEQALKEFSEVLDGPIDAKLPASGKLYAMLDSLLDLFVRRIDVSRLIYAIYYGPPEGAPYFNFMEFHERMCSAILALIEEGIKRKEFVDGNPVDMMWAVLGATHMAMESYLSQSDIVLDRSGLKRVLSIIFNGMVRKRGNVL